jgi:hypothetical protein
MVDISAIATALSALTAAKDIAQTMIGLRDTQAFQEQAIAFQGKILDAQTSVFAANRERTELIDRISELKAQISKMEAWESEKKRYRLTEISGGVYQYVLKAEEISSDNPLHSICVSCYQNSTKGILQLQGIDETRAWLICATCDKKVAVWTKDNPKLPRT